MRKLKNWFKNIFRFRQLLSLDLSNSMTPSLLFFKENLLNRSMFLRKEYSKNAPNEEIYEELKLYDIAVELIESIEEDNYLKAVGFDWDSDLDYHGTITWKGEKFDQYESKQLSEEDIINNIELIEKAEHLEQKDKKALFKIMKKILNGEV